MKRLIAVAVMVMSSTLYAQTNNYQWLPSPYNATGTVIQDQDKYDAQQQRLAPRNRQFLSRDTGQPYDAVTINQYMMGNPNTNYRVRPVVRQPMYGLPARD